MPNLIDSSGSMYSQIGLKERLEYRQTLKVIQLCLTESKGKHGMPKPRRLRRIARRLRQKLKL